MVREDKNVYITKCFKYLQICLGDPVTGEKEPLFVIHQAEARMLANKLLELAGLSPDPTFVRHEVFATEGAFIRDLPTRAEVVDPEYGININKQ